MVSGSFTVTIAIIGGGLIGPRHAQSVTRNPYTVLIALVDPAPHGPQLAADLRTNHYMSVSALISSPHRPDAAIICTPNSTHVPIAKELASAGIHILVEKPLSTDVGSGHSLIAHAKSCRVKLLVGHHRRLNSYVAVTKQILTSPHPKISLGRIIAVSGIWATYKPAAYFSAPIEWHQSSSGGVILINLVHELDILQYLLGPIIHVQALPTSKTRGYDADEGAAIILRFKSGTVGTFIISDAVPSPFNFESGTGENPMVPQTKRGGGKDFYRFLGTEATLGVPDMTRYSYEGEKSWKSEVREDRIDVNEDVPFDSQVAHFLKVIRGLEEPICSGEDGLSALVACEAVKEALRTGSGVDIELSKE